MTEEDLNNNIKKIINHFGERSQKNKAIEELKELIEAIHCDQKSMVMEEIADVIVMISQLVLIYKLDENKIERVAQEKVQRTLERIESGFYS